MVLNKSKHDYNLNVNNKIKSFIKYMVCGFAIFVVFLSLIDASYLTSHHTLLPSNASWHVNGYFKPYRNQQLFDHLPSPFSKDEKFNLWVSWSKDTNSRGRLFSPAFDAPSFLAFFIAGYPSDRGNTILIEDTVSGEKLAIPAKAADINWRKIVIRLPKDWRGKSIRIIAVDMSQTPRGWIGISTPAAVNMFSWVQFLFFENFLVFVLLFLMSIIAIHFLASGLMIGIVFFPMTALPKPFFTLFSFLIYALASYLLFWAYFFYFGLGCILSGLFLIFPMILFLPTFRQRTIKCLGCPDIYLPLLFMIVASLFYILLLYAVRQMPFDYNWLDHTYLRFGLAGDNMIPRLYAGRLFEQIDLRPPIIGSWLCSDRGPIQPGILLTQWPLWNLIDNISFLPNVLDFYAQSMGTFSQTIWIPAMWLLLYHLRVNRKQAAWLIVVLMPSGFLFFNSIYTWPKLAAGSFITFAYCIFIDGSLNGRLRFKHIILASMASGIGFLTHGSAAFSLIGMATVALYPRFFPGWKATVAGLLVFIAILAPYSIYKKFYNPPGNRLLKYHLAGMMRKGIDKRNFVEAAIDYYSDLNWSEFLHKKKENIENIMGTRLSWVGDPLTKSINIWRRMQFWSLIPSLDILHIGWLGLPLVFLQSKRKRQSLAILFAVAFFSLSAWVLLMTSEAGLHFCSYNIMLLLYAGLSVSLLSLPRWLYLPLLIAHAVHGLLLWGILARKASLIASWTVLAPIENYHYDPIFLAIATIIGTGIVFIVTFEVK